ncbi:AAA family ATPase [Konateibacter massiliensis]|uniref:hypothetical protein n=1 Tax=Konateibacter massiliensis TaxID=2002841 RepID=UPI000C160749|nr:hypothetical protein [Konateibacter massiliensis]
MILLKANDKLKTVFHKIIKTMGENVQWTEIFLINNNDLVLLGTGRSFFFNFDSKRAYSNIIDVTVNEDSTVQMGDNEMLENALNMTLYTFGKWGGIKGLKVEKDYEQLNKLLQYIVKEIDVEVSMTRDNLRFYKSGIQTTYEEVIQMILDKSKPEEEQPGNEPEETPEEEAKTREKEYSIGLWHKMVWTSEKMSFTKSELTGQDKAKSRLGNQFYMVNYKCPLCGEKLHMLVYPRGEEFRIETDEEPVYLSRAYTCKDCNSYYTPKPKRLLAEGEVFRLNFEDDKAAYEDYQELLGQKGQRTSNSNFNEYESDYLKKDKKEEESSNLAEQFEDYEAMTQEELNELLEKLEAGFYPEEIVEKYKRAIEQEIRKREAARNEMPQWEQASRDSDAEGRSKRERSGAKGAGKDERRGSQRADDTEGSRFGGGRTRMSGKGESQEKESDRDGENSSGYAGYTDTQDNEENDAGVTKLLPLSTEIFKRLAGLLERGDTASFERELENFPRHQLKELKFKIHSDTTISEEERKRGIEVLEQKIARETEKELKGKAEAYKTKSYNEIKRAIKEIKVEEAEESVKSSVLDSLSELLIKRGKNEIENLIKQLPFNLSKKQYEQLKEKLADYKEIDTAPYQKMLEQRRDEAEKEEISAFMKRSNPRNRSSYLETYNRLKEQDFEERNVTPVLEKLRQKVYDMDLVSIQNICREPADLSFEEGQQVYEQILLGEYLPELKNDMLDQIDKRLTKLKSDECEQLVSKLSKELGSYVRDVSRIHFYQVRKMLRGQAEDAGTVIMNNAIQSYAAGKEKYEYPILICDISYAANGESGFILTPNHIFYRSLMEGGKIDVMNIEEVFASSGLLGRGIYLRTKSGQIKISNSLKAKDLKNIARVLNHFVGYLKEKPESRNVSYMAKEVHKVKCCYRCGYVYQKGNVCPKCGSKMND